MDVLLSFWKGTSLLKFKPQFFVVSKEVRTSAPVLVGLGEGF